MPQGTITENDIQPPAAPQAPVQAKAQSATISDSDIVGGAPAPAVAAPPASTPNQPPIGQVQAGAIDKPPVTGIGPTAKSMGAGIYHFITDVLDWADYGAPIYDPKNPHGPPIGKKNTPLYGDPTKVLDPQYHGEPNSLWNKYVASPLIEEGRKADALAGIDDPGAQASSMGHRVASWIPFLGPLAATGAQQIGQARTPSEFAGGALTAGAAVLGASQLGKGAEAVKQGVSSIAPGKQATVNASNAVLERSSTTAKSDLAVAQSNVGKRIGSLVNELSDSDLEDSSSNGRVGSIATAPAFNALMSGLNKFGATFQKTPNVTAVEDLLKSAGPDARLPWESVKDIRSAVGQIMYRTSEGSKERAVIGESYATLTGLLKSRADFLGKTDEFNAYNDLHGTMMDYLHDGILGDLFNTKNGIDFFNFIKKPSNQPELTRLNNDLGKFGLADNFFTDLAKNHKETHSLAKLAESGQDSGMIGKFRAVARRPVAASAAFIPISLLPLPGKLLWSIMAAAKGADLADRIAAAREIRKLGGTPQVTGKFGKAADVMPQGNPTPFRDVVRGGKAPEGEE